MKKLIALLLALVMVIGLVACGAKEEAAAPAAPEAAPAATEAAKEEAPAEEAAPEAGAILTEEEAAEARDAGTLVGDPYAGYDYNEGTATWYYSNYPNYKDFKEDGKVKVAFVCKFSGAWFTPKANSLGETVQAAGYEYLFVDANSDEQAWIDGVENVINQDFDVVVLTPPNTALLADAIAMLQDAGMAYLTTDDPGPDVDGFYAPHYGLDDYYLYNECAKAAAERMQTNGFMDVIADDWSNFKLIIMDSPSVEAIHKRDQGVEDAFRAAFPDMPDDAVVWLDCGAGLQADINNKLAPALNLYGADTDKWVFASGTGSSTIAAAQILKEYGMKAEDFILIDTCGAPDSCQLMLTDDYAASYMLVGLASAPSGVGMGELIIDLVENGTPIPCMTPYDLIIVDKDSAQAFTEAYYPDALAS